MTDDADADAAGPSSSPVKIEPQEMAALATTLQRAVINKKEIKEKYAFWETQPVTQFHKKITGEVRACHQPCTHHVISHASIMAALTLPSCPMNFSGGGRTH